MSFNVIVWVMHNSEEALGRRLVLLALAENANDDGSGAWPSVETLSRKSRLSTRQVKRCLKGLAEDGAIVSEGVGPRGTQSWAIVMAPEVISGDDNLSSAEGGGGDNLSKNGAESGQDVTRTCPSEPVLTPSSPPSRLCSLCGTAEDPAEGCPVCQIFMHWQETMGHPRAVLDLKRRRDIRNGLKIATVSECLQAVSGCRRSDFHMAKGEYKGRTRYDSLNVILRDRDQIEKFVAMAPAQTAGVNGAGGLSPAALHALIGRHKRNVLAAYDLAGSDEAKRKGDEARCWLEQHGISVVMSESGRPGFVTESP
jgi:hypothetical protein